MAFCMKCGAPLPENAAACPQCGAAAGGTTPPKAENQPNYQPPEYQPEAPAYEPVKTDFTDDFDEEDREGLKWIIALGYLSPFFLVFPMLNKQGEKLVRFHLNQSLALTVLLVVSSLVMIVPFLGWLVGAVGYGFWAVLLVIDIVRVFQRKAQWTPLIGKYVILPENK